MIDHYCRCPGCGECEHSRAARTRSKNKAEELLRIIVLNAELIPDPRMQGATDCYRVPCDDIEDARKLLGVAPKLGED